MNPSFDSATLGRNPPPARPSHPAPSALVEVPKVPIRALPWAPLLLVLSVIVPPQVKVNVGGFSLDAVRVACIVCFFPAVLRMINGRCGKPILADYLMPLWGVWVTAASAVNHDADKAMQWGGAYFLETFGAYAVGRAYVTDLRKFTGFSRLMLRIVFLLLIYNVVESVTGRRFIQELVTPMFGGGPRRIPDPRWGLARAFGPFAHPILNGVFCATTVGLGFYLSARNHKVRYLQIQRALWTTAAAFFSLSSGAVAMLGVQYLIFFWTRATHGVRNRWRILLGILAGLYVAVEFVSNRPAKNVFLYYLTFSPTTAYNRMIIWDEGIKSVFQHPLFGIGDHEWNHPTWMSNSMDAFWLVVFVQYGIPAGLCLTISAFGIAKRIGKSIDGWSVEDLVRRAWLASFVGIALAGVTVHFWGQIQVLLCVFLGAGVCLIPPHLRTSRGRR